MEGAVGRGKVLSENENKMEEPSQTSVVGRKFITKFTNHRGRGRNKYPRKLVLTLFTLSF